MLIISTQHKWNFILCNHISQLLKTRFLPPGSFLDIVSTVATTTSFHLLFISVFTNYHWTAIFRVTHSNLKWKIPFWNMTYGIVILKYFATLFMLLQLCESQNERYLFCTVSGASRLNAEYNIWSALGRLHGRLVSLPSWLHRFRTLHCLFVNSDVCMFNLYFLLSLCRLCCSISLRFPIYSHRLQTYFLLFLSHVASLVSSVEG
jgi:hypothetical protein